MTAEPVLNMARQLGTRLSHDVRQLDDDMFAEIEAGLLAHGVVCLPGQQLAPAELHSLAARFGPPVPPAWGGRPVEFPLSQVQLSAVSEHNHALHTFL